MFMQPAREQSAYDVSVQNLSKRDNMFPASAFICTQTNTHKGL